MIEIFLKAIQHHLATAYHHDEHTNKVSNKEIYTYRRFIFPFPQTFKHTSLHTFVSWLIYTLYKIAVSIQTAQGQNKVYSQPKVNKTVLETGPVD